MTIDKFLSTFPDDILDEDQKNAVRVMSPGCILNGKTGSGKSRAGLAYYKFNFSDRPLYILTTAKKRDDKEWEEECKLFDISPKVVDSWNNIQKYINVFEAFFILDEQRISGKGKWVKAFLKISKRNKWILLSATPGDKWEDYIPVFLAHGFYRTRGEFKARHYIYNPYNKKYPQVIGCRGEAILRKYRDMITVNMKDKRQTKCYFIDISVKFDRDLYKVIWRDRINPYEGNIPIRETGKLGYLLRKAVNEDISRVHALELLLEQNPKTIIFYNFQYERDIIESVCKLLKRTFKQWNGQVHEKLPKGDSWVYAVQYIAGSEGWNCTTTNVLIFYSDSYSYKKMVQAAGRINRMNTSYRDLYYYRFKTTAPIDIAVRKSLSEKKEFNEQKYITGKR